MRRQACFLQPPLIDADIVGGGESGKMPPKRKAGFLRETRLLQSYSASA
jgi:hypothetical protein